VRYTRSYPYQMTDFRLQPLAQPVDINLRGANLAEQFHFAHPDRIGDRDRILVDIQTQIQRAIVLHADLRGGIHR